MKLKTRKIDFTQWEMFGEDEQQLLTLMNKVAGDITNIYLERIKAEFPKIWAPKIDGRRGKDVADPLTIFLVDQDAFDYGDHVYAEFSLSEALIDYIEQCEEDGSFAHGLRQISASMKDLANRIDAACAKHDD